MKIALLITGHMRCWKQLYPAIKEKYLDAYNPDVYLSVWDTEGWWQWGDFYRNSTNINDEEVLRAFRPVKYVKEKNSNFDYLFNMLGSKYTNTYGYAKNTISMMYKWKNGIDLIENNYDLVIRTRTDVHYLESFPDFNPENFYTAEQPGVDQGGLGDMIHVGSLKDMKVFCNIFNELDNIYNQLGVFCPHLMTEQHVKNSKFKWIEFKNPYKLYNTPWGQHQDVNKFINQ